MVTAHEHDTWSIYRRPHGHGVCAPMWMSVFTDMTNATTPALFATTLWGLERTNASVVMATNQRQALTAEHSVHAARFALRAFVARA